MSEIIQIELDHLEKNNISFIEFSFLLAIYKQKQLIISDILLKLPGFEVEMESKGYIKIFQDGLILREKALSLLSSPLEKATQKVESWIDEWRNIFPKGMNSVGFPFRGNRAECIKKMKKFTKQHPNVKKGVIINATLEYVTRFSIKHPPYAYMQLAHYFIEKQGSGSQLETEIENLLNKSNISNKPIVRYGEQEFEFPSVDKPKSSS